MKQKERRRKISLNCLKSCVSRPKASVEMEMK